jgi:gliding motility-associated-like protein
MEEKDFIKDLFQEKLSNFETPVRLEVWSSISSSIGATSATTGLSFITKFIIRTSLTAAVSTGIWFAVSNSDNGTKLKKEPIKIEKPIFIETNEDYQNKEATKPKFSDVQIKTETEKISLTIPESELKFDNLEIEENLKPNNSISEFKSFTPEKNQDLEPMIEQRIVTKSDSKVDNLASVLNADSKPKPTLSDVKINLPNVFTPDGDGTNDYLTIPKVELKDFSLVILNEKGETIFTTIDIEFSWDGTLLNGEKSPAGNYVYFITGKDNNGKTFNKYSNLNIRY